MITAYDLNKPAIKCQVGFGDDPKLAASCRGNDALVGRDFSRAAERRN
jgi:hypothetical protein